MYIIIVGCGRVGSELAKLLADAGHNVVVVDKDASSFQRLGADFNGLTITGDGFDVDLLKEAGIEQADAFCTVTDNDNANIMSGQVAKKIFNIPKVITRINDAQYTQIYRELGIEVVSSTMLLTSMIRDKITESRLSGFLLEDSRLGTMEIEAGDKVAGKSIEELNLPGELMIVAIVKKRMVRRARHFSNRPEQSQREEVSIPRPKDRIEKGDFLIGIVKTESLAKIKKFLGLK